MKKLFDLFVIDEYTVDELVTDKQTLTLDPEQGETIRIVDVLNCGVSENTELYKGEMSWAASRIDEYLEKHVSDELRIVATRLLCDYEYAASFYGFLMGFKVAVQLMNARGQGLEGVCVCQE